jgi:hypothetical protein
MAQSSESLYTTFGNELKYRITAQTLEAYLENATIKFPLPEASSTILGELAAIETINGVELDAVSTKLQSIGFGNANARAMASVLIQVAQGQGVSPMDYFSSNEAALKLAVDSYATINLLRPAGNRINVVAPRKNSNSRFNKLIRP